LERERDVDGLLAGHRVEHEQDVRRPDGPVDLGQLLHQLLVDLETAGGVDDHDVAAVRARLLEAELRGRDWILALRAVDRDLDLLAELLELRDGGGALQVCCDERRSLALLPQHQRELGGGCRLPGALESGEQDHGRGPPGEREPRVGGAHDAGQLLVDDLHDLLSGRKALRHLLAERTLLHGGGELLDDAEIDVGFEQREADLAHGFRDRLLVERSALAEAAEDRLQLVAEGVEHPNQFTEVYSASGSTRARAKSPGPNGCRSSRVSPTPISFTGRPRSTATERTIPPFAVPSSFVSTTPGTSTASLNRRACWSPFWPVVASRTRSVSGGAPSSRPATTRRILASSSIKFDWV